jgi:transcriptional regulator with XRE-family HTH domain
MSRATPAQLRDRGARTSRVARATDSHSHRDKTPRNGRRAAGAFTLPMDGTPFPDLEIKVGKRLRELRTAKGISLADLAKAAEISVGNLSEIERGLAVPSIRTFCQLSKALGIGAGWLLEQSGAVHANDDPYVIRATARQSIIFSKPGVVKRLASPPGAGNLQMLLVEIDPGAGSGEQGYSHAGEECGIVFEGILDLWIDGEKRTLASGDSFRFPSTKIHRFHNPGNVLTRVVWVTSPPLY